MLNAEEEKLPMIYHTCIVWYFKAKNGNIAKSRTYRNKNEISLDDALLIKIHC